MKCYLFECNDGYLSYAITNDELIFRDYETKPNMIEVSFSSLEQTGLLSRSKKMKFISCEYEEDVEMIAIFSNTITHSDFAPWFEVYPTEGGFINTDGITYGESISLRNKSTGKVYSEVNKLFNYL